MIQYDSNGIITQNLTEIIGEYEEKLRPILGDEFKVDKNSPIGSIILAMANNEVAIQELIAWLPNMMNANTAEGIFLDYICEKNRIYRYKPEKTTLQLTINGTKNTSFSVNDISVLDTKTDISYDLNQDCIIGEDGKVKAEFICRYDGEYTPYLDSTFTIQTPLDGLDSVSFNYNEANISVGRLVEQDEELRARRNESVGQCATSTLESIKAMLSSTQGVLNVTYFENDTESTNADGLPMKSFEFVVDGGDENEITDTIFVNKVPGSRAYGSTIITKTNSEGNVFGIGYTKANVVNVGFDIKIEVSAIQANSWTEEVKQAIKSHFDNIQKIGSTVKDYNYIKILTNYPEITDIESIKVFDTAKSDTKYSQLPIGKKQVAKLNVDNINIVMEH